MAKLRQLVLYKPAAGGKQAPLGTRSEIIKALAPFNTAPDGSGDTTIAFGPGFTIQFPLTDARDDVNQCLIAIIEEEIAVSVLLRICKNTAWALLDPDSGRVFGQQPAHP